MRAADLLLPPGRRSSSWGWSPRRPGRSRRPRRLPTAHARRARGSSPASRRSGLELGVGDQERGERGLRRRPGAPASTVGDRARRVPAASSSPAAAGE